MSFFGLPEPGFDLEAERARYLAGSSNGGLEEIREDNEDDEDLAARLQETGDELNDDTFGETGNIGKDFDFSASALPTDGLPSRNTHLQSIEALFPQEPLQHQHQQQRQQQPLLYQHQQRSATQTPTHLTPSLESLWHSSSPMSASNGHNIMRNITPNAGPTLREIEEGMRTGSAREAQRHEALIRETERMQLEQLRLRELQESRMLSQLQQLQLQQQGLPQHQPPLQYRNTPPPRMLPGTQSPRFQHQLQEQIIALQQQQAREKQQQLQRLEREGLYRLMMGRESPHQQFPDDVPLQAQQSHLALAELQAAQMARLRQQQQQQQQQQQHMAQIPRGQSPFDVNPSLGQNISNMPHDIQSQQRIMSQAARAMFHGMSRANQEEVQAEAVRKILEAEKMENRRKRKAEKIAAMSRNNDLMTQGDKDFITRIQVSQLVAPDPYMEDFYAQVYDAILRSRAGAAAVDNGVLKFGSSGGIALGKINSGITANRPQRAMQRMEAQVDRLLANSRLREKEKGQNPVNNLQGALGKTSGRSYKAAPRQVLQVDEASPSDSPQAQNAAQIDPETFTNGMHEPLTHRQALIILESMYDILLEIEQLRRDQPEEDVEDAVFNEWESIHNTLVQRLWEGFRVNLPIKYSDPHPFISLLAPIKGKRFIPRLIRLITPLQTQNILTLIIANFQQLDVFKMARYLDTIEDTDERLEAQKQTQAFESHVIQSMLPTIAGFGLEMVNGMLGIWLDTQDIVTIAQTRPGQTLLTLFMHRVENIKTTTDPAEMPTTEAAQEWFKLLAILLDRLLPHFANLFPSTRIAPDYPGVQHPRLDIMDQPTWQLLASIAQLTSEEDHKHIVLALRGKILESVHAVNKGYVTNEEERLLKLGNINLLLHAIGLDSSQMSGF